MRANWPEAIVAAFLAAAWAAIMAAYALSAAFRLDAAGWWVWLLVVLTVPLFWLFNRVSVISLADPSSRVDDRPSPAIVAALGVTAAVAIVANLVTAAFTTPGSWDALAYHLPRAALSLQAHHLYDGPVNFWAQSAHPQYSTALLAVPAALTGANEHVWPAWQIGGWFAAAGGVISLARSGGASPRAALLGGFLFLLLPQSITQAPTANNDMVLAAVAGAGVLAAVRWADVGGWASFCTVVAAVGLGLGIKATFACQAAMISVVGVAAATAKFRLRSAAAMAAALLLGAVIAANAGYIKNLHRYGSVLGPREAAAHASSGGLRSILVEGVLNTARLATDFASLDGLPPVGPFLRVQRLIRRGVAAVWHLVVPAPLQSRGLRAPFLLDRPMLAHENHSYWGIAGLLVIWPAVVWALFRASGTARALALGAVAFVVLQGFAGPYDPWRGRYFLSSAVVAVPVAAIAADRLARRAVAWQWIAVVLVCITALNTALLRSGARLFPVRYGGVVYDSVWSMDGAAQLARHRPEYADAIREYERLVPSGSSVISAVAPDSPEFVLFGRNLENTVIPLGAERQELTLPVRADYAVFSDRRFRPSPDDRHLGADWWLRRLGRD